MDAVAALKKSEGGANIQKSQSVGSLLWRSNASVNSPRTLVVRNEALSSSTYSLNWSGAQVHTARKLSSQSEANLQEGEILAPTVCWLSLVFLVQVYAVADPELGDGCKGTWIKLWRIVSTAHKRSLEQGNIFTSVCHSFYPQRVGGVCPTPPP